MNTKALLVFLVLTVVFLFYWFEIRPSEIRKWCAIESEGDGMTSVAERDLLGGNILKINDKEREKGEYWYYFCLNKNGLAK